MYLKFVYNFPLEQNIKQEKISLIKKIKEKDKYPKYGQKR